MFRQVCNRGYEEVRNVPEVVAPFSQAVGLINADEGQWQQRPQGIQQRPALQTLWCNIDHTQLPFLQKCTRSHKLLCVDQAGRRGFDSPTFPQDMLSLSE